MIPRLNVEIKWQTKYECVKRKGLGFTSIILIIIAAAIVLYFLVGIPIMFALGKRGFEVIPFFGMWKTLFGYVIDGITVLTPCCPCSNERQGYTALSQ